MLFDPESAHGENAYQIQKVATHTTRLLRTNESHIRNINTISIEF